MATYDQIIRGGLHPLAPKWKKNAILDDKGWPVLCGHRNCSRYAVRTVSYEAPNHREFFGQTHDCCSVHSRAPKEKS